MTCDVTADRKKSLLWGDAVFAGVFGVAALILALMDALDSGSLLIALWLQSSSRWRSSAR